MWTNINELREEANKKMKAIKYSNIFDNKNKLEIAAEFVLHGNDAILLHETIYSDKEYHNYSVLICNERVCWFGAHKTEIFGSYYIIHNIVLNGNRMATAKEISKLMMLGKLTQDEYGRYLVNK